MSTIAHTEAHLEDGDQKNFTTPGEEQEAELNKFNQGKDNAHAPFDIKDDRSLANRAAAAELREKAEDLAAEDANAKPPTAAATDHGNKPSRGAEIDEEIEKEEEEEMKKKGKI